MSSIVLLIPIIAVAVFSVYRYVKKEVSGSDGSGGCRHCGSRDRCQMNNAMTKRK